MTVEQAYQTLYGAALIVLLIMIGAMVIRSIIGPRSTDRIMSVNMLGTMTIADWAFVECSGLTSAVIPETVTRMGEGVFFHCPLDLNFWVEKDSYAEEWCRQNGYIESMRYMDGSVPEDRSEE